MQCCAFCGAEFPDNARFCGRCGRVPRATLDAPTTPSLGQALLGPKQEAEAQGERRRRAFLLDLSFSPGGGAQRGAGQLPMVQRTPQMSGVPMVQGTPSSVSGAPAVSAVSSSTASPAASLPGPPQAPPASSAKPVPIGSPHLPQEPFHHERQGQHLPGKLHVPRPGGSAPARVIGSVHKGFHIALAGLVVIVTGGIVLALIHSHYAGGGPPRPGTNTTFSVPTAGSTLLAITAGPDGNLWFLETWAHKIGRITPQGKITEFTTTVAGDIQAITKGPDGNLWFTEYFGNQIGRITPGAPGPITEFAIPTADSGPTDITLGPDGNLWFTQHNGMIGRITPGGVISEFPLPAADSSPSAITAGPDGNLWFIESNGDKIGRMIPEG